MKYIIVTPHPKDCKEEILQCVKDGEDRNGSSIDTWMVKTVRFRTEDDKTFTEDVLVHNVLEWKDTGYIRLFVDKQGNNQIHAKFYYWSKFPEEERDGSHELYIYGRLTELLLVHFSDSIRSIMITEI